METSQLLFILLLSLSGVWVQAQDTILKTDQTEIAAKVTEITTDEVKFKYTSRLDGPTYSLRKSEVFVIIYKDGTREKFNEAVAKPAAPASSQPYVQKPAVQPVPAASAASSASDESTEKRTGLIYNIGYATPSQALGESSGFAYGSGFYFLGPGRKGGGMIDVDIMNFFGDGNLTYGIIALNGILRTSSTSRFYFGGGLGYAYVSVKVKGQYGLEKTVSSGDLGGKAFMGYGLFRAALIWPSFEGAGSGGLATIGICTNPFK